MIFKGHDEIFSYKAMNSDEQMKKEGDKYKFQPVLIEIDTEHIFGIWLEVKRNAGGGTHYLSFYNIKDDGYDQIGVFHNDWRHISINAHEGVLQISVGDDVMISSKEIWPLSPTALSRMLLKCSERMYSFITAINSSCLSL